MKKDTIFFYFYSFLKEIGLKNNVSIFFKKIEFHFNCF